MADVFEMPRPGITDDLAIQPGGDWHEVVTVGATAARSTGREREPTARRSGLSFSPDQYPSEASSTEFERGERSSPKQRRTQRQAIRVNAAQSASKRTPRCRDSGA